VLKFLLVEDHPMMRAAIRTVVETLSGDVATAEAGTVSQARELLAHHGRFDAVVLEIRVGGADGVALLREMRASQPGMPVMVFTGSDDGRDLIRAVDGGAMAFVHKRSDRGEVLKALETVMGGGIYLPADMASLLDSARAGQAVEAALAVDEPVEAPRTLGLHGFQVPAPSAQIIARLGLTPRQTDVLLLLLHGKPNKLIARELNLSVETIKDHVAAVLRSLNVSSRTQAVLAITQMASIASASTAARRGLQ
jgi:DNA-binding NarL/FixJ family response regulator